MAKLAVDSENCIGCGACMGSCPSLFKFNADHRSVPKKTDVTGEEAECAKRAASACPAQVISVTE